MFPSPDRLACSSRLFASSSIARSFAGGTYLPPPPPEAPPSAGFLSSSFGSSTHQKKHFAGSKALEIAGFQSFSPPSYKAPKPSICRVFAVSSTDRRPHPLFPRRPLACSWASAAAAAVPTARRRHRHRACRASCLHRLGYRLQLTDVPHHYQAQ